MNKERLLKVLRYIMLVPLLFYSYFYYISGIAKEAATISLAWNKTAGMYGVSRVLYVFGTKAYYSGCYGNCFMR